MQASCGARSRSWRRRSAHREEGLEEAVLHVQTKPANSGGQARHTYSCRFVQQGAAGLHASHHNRPRRRTRARRASRAGPGAPRRSRSQRTGTITSQQQALELVVDTLVPQHICSTQQVSGAHTTSRCSSAAVGEGPSRSTVESTSPHSRLHGRRERRDHRANQPSRIYLSSPKLAPPKICNKRGGRPPRWRTNDQPATTRS